jgi:SagB-type dehydrogenase family enzyme
MSGKSLLILGVLLLAASVMAQDLKTIPLPAPDTTGGKPLMQVLKMRQTSREFSADSIPLPVLSNLLWAACGVNRAESGKRTAPSAMNWQEIDVYVVTVQGTYRYDSKTHALQQILTGDIREKTGAQPFVKEVPVNLVYVADYAKVTRGSDEDKTLYSAADAGFISQNVYLFCASEGLATVVRGSVDKAELAKAMSLRADQKIILAQSVGYAKKIE